MAAKKNDKPQDDEKQPAMISREDAMPDHPKPAEHDDDLDQEDREKPLGNATDEVLAEEAHEEPLPEQHRIEDLLKDNTFDPEGKYRVALAHLLQEGHEFAPPEMVEGR